MTEQIWRDWQVGLEKGVIFLTYSSLTSSSDKGDTRLQQLVDWAGTDYDGLIIFDECHKAKNLIPEAGSKPTKVKRFTFEPSWCLSMSRV